MRKVSLSILLLIAACSGSDFDSDIIETGFGDYVVEIILDDGTHCAVSSDGGIDCDWRER